MLVACQSGILPVFKMEECREPPPTMERGAIPEPSDFYELQERYLRGGGGLRSEAEDDAATEVSRRRRRKILPLMRYRQPLCKVRRRLAGSQPRRETEIPRLRRAELFDYESLHGGSEGFKSLGEGCGAANDVASWMRKFARYKGPEVEPVPKMRESPSEPCLVGIRKPALPKVRVVQRKQVPPPPAEPRPDLRERAEAARLARDLELQARDAFLDEQVRKVAPEGLAAEKRHRYLFGQPKPKRRPMPKRSARVDDEPHFRQHRQLLERYRSALLPVPCGDNSQEPAAQQDDLDERSARNDGVEDSAREDDAPRDGDCLTRNSGSEGTDQACDDDDYADQDYEDDDQPSSRRSDAPDVVSEGNIASRTNNDDDDAHSPSSPRCDDRGTLATQATGIPQDDEDDYGDAIFEDDEDYANEDYANEDFEDED